MTTFPLNNIPGQIIIELIQFVGLWFNQNPPENWVLDMYSPQNIIMVQDLAYDKHWNFRFGSYVEAEKDRKITNGLEE